MRYLTVYNKRDHKFEYMSTLWTNEELFEWWDVISEHNSLDEAKAEHDKPKPYFVLSSFPCLLEDIYPDDNKLPAFTISAGEEKESYIQYEPDYDENPNHYNDWWDINITDETLTKENAILLIKKYKGINITIEEHKILTNI